MLECKNSISEISSILQNAVENPEVQRVGELRIKYIYKYNRYTFLLLLLYFIVYYIFIIIILPDILYLLIKFCNCIWSYWRKR